MWPAPVQEADRAGAARRAMWDIGQARRRTLSASSTGPLGCLSAGISSVGRLNRMPRYAFRRPTLYLPRRKSNAGRMECEKCGLTGLPSPNSHWFEPNPNAYRRVSPASHRRRGAGLLQRMRAGEGVDRLAGVDDPVDRRIGRHVDLVEARASRLARQANVGDGHRIAVAIAPGFLPLEMRLDRGERFPDPVLTPRGP